MRPVKMKSQLVASNAAHEADIAATAHEADIAAIKAGIQAGLEKMAAEVTASAKAIGALPLSGPHIGRKPWPFGTILRPSQKRMQALSNPKSIAHERLLVLSDDGSGTFSGIIVSTARVPRAERDWARSGWEPDK